MGLVAAALVIAVLIGGYAYDRSERFRLECGLHKNLGYPLKFPKNVICDLDFQR